MVIGKDKFMAMSKHFIRSSYFADIYKLQIIKYYDIYPLTSSVHRMVKYKL